MTSGIAYGVQSNTGEIIFPISSISVLSIWVRKGTGGGHFWMRQ